jgi:hypothetical protein
MAVVTGGSCTYLGGSVGQHLLKASPKKEEWAGAGEGRLEVGVEPNPQGNL